MSSAAEGRLLWGRRSHPVLAVMWAAMLLAAPRDAWAGASSDTFEVTATVLQSCSVVAQDLAFGAYDPVAASALDGATTMSVTCTNGTPYAVSLNLGNGVGATTAARYMTSGANTLAYTLYRDSNRTQLWGQSAGTDTLSGTGSGSPQTIDVYGEIAMQQAAPAGSYQDTITVTVSW